MDLQEYKITGNPMIPTGIVGDDGKELTAVDAYQLLEELSAEVERLRANPSLVMSGYQLKSALEFVNPDGDADKDQQETELVITQRQAFIEEEKGQQMPAGLYAHLLEYPGEGLYGPLHDGEE